ncbi:hypothetical protein GQ42DRAFT_161326 [Ramicandelaber brevisporus]|nr:hypothetical protein GQ42DRAFT_161326 [Ramicandelaber brevisporus]
MLSTGSGAFGLPSRKYMKQRRRRRILYAVAAIAGLSLLWIVFFGLPFRHEQQHASHENRYAAMGKLHPQPPAYMQEPDTDHSWAAHRDYAVVIDAGSSGSRVYIYSWKNPEHIKRIASVTSAAAKSMLHGLPVIEKGDEHGKHWSFKETPGISTYGKRPMRVHEHLQPLLEYAMKTVPAAKVPSTPVYLLATAGMRLLPDDQRAAVLQETCDFIKGRYYFAVGDCAQHIRVISGEMEGIYGWLTTNYLMDGFLRTGEKRGHGVHDPNAPHRQAHGAEDETNHAIELKPNTTSKHTFGFLDMGGASTQIAFEPTGSVAIEHADDLSTITLRNLDGNSHVYKVFVTTFLGYGTNEARKRYVRDLFYEHEHDHLAGTTREHAIEDPCLPHDLILQVPALEGSDGPKTRYLHGTGSFQECLRRTETMLNKHAECPTDPCLFNGVHTPEIDFDIQQFIGISEYWYSSHEILGLGGIWDFVEFEHTASSYCATPWNQIDQDHRDKKTGKLKFPERYQMQCFKAAWLANVLHEGIGVPRIGDDGGDHGVNVMGHITDVAASSDIAESGARVPFQSVDTINNFQISWTLGSALLHAVGSIQPSAKERSMFGGSTTKTGVEFPDLFHQHLHQHAHHLDDEEEERYTESLFADLQDLSDDHNALLYIITALLVLGLAVLGLCIYSMRRGRSDGILGGSAKYQSSGGPKPHSRLPAVSTSPLGRAASWINKATGGAGPLAFAKPPHANLPSYDEAINGHGSAGNTNGPNDGLELQVVGDNSYGQGSGNISTSGHRSTLTRRTGDAFESSTPLPPPPESVSVIWEGAPDDSSLPAWR